MRKTYAISQQFPKEVLEKRRSLIPTLKSLRDQGKRAYISVDKLFIDGRIYKGPLIESNESTNRQGTSGRGWGQGRGRGFGRIAGQGQGRGRGREHDQGQTPNTGVATGLLIKICLEYLKQRIVGRVKIKVKVKWKLRAVR